MKILDKIEKKKISLEEITKLCKIYNYPELAKYIKKNIDEGRLKPIIGSGTNGKKPALYNSYKIIVEKNDNYKYLEELQYKLDPLLDIDYYMKYPDKYIEDREVVLAFSRYLENNKDLLKETVSVNERSFEIWGREKFIQKGSGRRILKNLGFTVEDLNIYKTAEPLAYYSHHKETPQYILILENKDTFYSMRRHLLKGNDKIIGIPIGTLIYGGGKSINKAFDDFTIHAEPYLNNKRNIILYFGDLDYEGIIIYESLRERLKNKFDILLFRDAYLRMLEKADKCVLPITKEGQNRNIGKNFMGTFNEYERAEIFDILESNRYIPQEILNIRDF